LVLLKNINLIINKKKIFANNIKMAQFIQQAFNVSGLDGMLTSALQNPYVSTGLVLFLALYGGMAAPQLPAEVLALFDNALFRLAVLFLVAYTGNRNSTVSLLTAVAFVVSMNALNQKKSEEAFGYN